MTLLRKILRFVWNELLRYWCQWSTWKAMLKDLLRYYCQWCTWKAVLRECILCLSRSLLSSLLRFLSLADTPTFLLFPRLMTCDLGVMGPDRLVVGMLLVLLEELILIPLSLWVSDTLPPPGQSDTLPPPGQSSETKNVK